LILLVSGKRERTLLHINLIIPIGSFHVGSGCEDPSSFRDAVERARKVFDMASQYGFELNLLDVGGGYPGSQASNAKITFESVAAVLGPAVDELFPDRNIRVISEPGRYYVSNAFTLAVQVTSRRLIEGSNQEKSLMYYLNDGIYGSFNCVIFDHALVAPKILSRSAETGVKNDRLFPCSLWGPTCDSIDCLGKDLLLPELNIGDWLQFDAMGAYTMASASTFNGFKKTKVLYTSTYGVEKE
jgi:ornithine decarboxylase